MQTQEKTLGTFSTFSIGIGGMVGGGIFATTGLAIQLTQGAAPIAFIVAGIVALLTSYSYLKLTLRYPSEGGTVEFINRGLGQGIFSGAANILLCFSYVTLIAIYAHALGNYAASFIPPDQVEFWRHTFLSFALIALTLLNVFGGSAVIKSENTLNIIKMLILFLLIAVGLYVPNDWQRLSTDNYVGSMAIISGAMIVFFNYEGFELIANSAKEVKNPKRSLPIAYIGGVLTVIAVYILIAVVTIGHLSFLEIASVSNHALTAVANYLMGPTGHVLIVIAAVVACGSAINATLYSAGRLTATIANTGELPTELERKIKGQPLEGMLIFSALALIIANFVPLGAIATMGSAGFLTIFMIVNYSNAKLAKDTQSKAWISVLGALCCGASLVLLGMEVDENPATENQLWIVVGTIVLSFLLEGIYRWNTKRKVAANLR
ncbi:APC family permease [Colwellia echini]|uniref:Amino acid permease n=1 Tax=Colwellia echini TaxID=1982103 RepID=A0ABY3N0N4_9GAMM|nr:APC family permease [Colwellia echini]TYK67050.1 amino acid permease [Colwellia echini]